jgi:hypothetical protein
LLIHSYFLEGEVFSYTIESVVMTSYSALDEREVGDDGCSNEKTTAQKGVS